MPQLIAVYGTNFERFYANRITLDYLGVGLRSEHAAPGRQARLQRQPHVAGRGVGRRNVGEGRAGVEAAARDGGIAGAAVVGDPSTAGIKLCVAPAAARRPTKKSATSSVIDSVLLLPSD